jgi:hypothetical protein
MLPLILQIILHESLSQLPLFPKFIIENQIKNFQNGIYILCCAVWPQVTTEKFPVPCNLTAFPFAISAISITL